MCNKSVTKIWRCWFGDELYSLIDAGCKRIVWCVETFQSWRKQFKKMNLSSVQIGIASENLASTPDLHAGQLTVVLHL